MGSDFFRDVNSDVTRARDLDVTRARDLDINGDGTRDRTRDLDVNGTRDANAHARDLDATPPLPGYPTRTSRQGRMSPATRVPSAPPAHVRSPNDE